MKLHTVFVLLIFATTLPAAPESSPRPDEADHMVGEYVVVGKYPDSEQTYQGKVTIQTRGQELTFIRVIDGRTIEGIARFDTATADKLPVLRLTFSIDGKQYEGSYLWRVDLDNYFRFSGYLFLANGETKTPGLEALFPAEPLRE